MLRVIFISLIMTLSAEMSCAAERLMVFAPASMTDVMKTLANDFQRTTKQEVVLSIAGTAQLARQLDAGAPAHIFISADKRWMDWVENRTLINPASRIKFAGNRLVVAVRRETENWADFEALFTEFPFAMGEPDSVPVGHYTREALVAKGWWKKAKSNAVYSENARITLRRLALGEVGSAIVYSTDVAVEPAVKSILTFPENSHTQIGYWAAATKFEGEGGQAFLSYLLSAGAAKALAEAGFLAPSKAN